MAHKEDGVSFDMIEQYDADEEGSQEGELLDETFACSCACKEELSCKAAGFVAALEMAQFRAIAEAGDSSDGLLGTFLGCI